MKNEFEVDIWFLYVFLYVYIYNKKYKGDRYDVNIKGEVEDIKK